MKLIIKNKGAIPIHMLTHLGISTARSEETKIGQFGSGAKHGMLTALRAGHLLKIYSGNTEIIPKFMPMGLDNSIEELILFVDGRPHTTAMTRGFGEIDWESNINLALREFISNAIDQGETARGCWFLAEDVVTSPDTTLVVFELTGAIQAFLDDFHNWYVDKPLSKPFTPQSSQTGICYLKGVRVGELASEYPALYNYNFDKVRLNESRTVDADTLRTAASALINTDVEYLKETFRHISGFFFETRGFISYNVPYYAEAAAERIRTAWKAVHGDSYPATDLDVKFFTAKKIPYVVVSRNWYDILTSATVDLSYDKKKSTLEERYVFGPPSDEMILMLDKAWSIFESVNLTGRKPKPQCSSFIQTDDQTTLGMLFNKVVYFNDDEPVSMQTAIEELIHYVFDVVDESRGFQEAALKLATKLARKVLADRA